LAQYDIVNKKGEDVGQVETFTIDMGEGRIWKLAWHQRQVICHTIGRFKAASGDNEIQKGRVHSWEQREEAQRVAWAVPGISQIENHILIIPWSNN
jgi:sporulation protein YlmC with PRC-barrel domain